MGEEKSSSVIFIIPSLEPGGAELQTISQLNYINTQLKIDVHLIILCNKCSLVSSLDLPQERIHILSQNKLSVLTKPLLAYLPYLLKNTYNIINRTINGKEAEVIAILPMAHLVSRMCKLSMRLIGKCTWKLTCYYRSTSYQINPLHTQIKIMYNVVMSKLAHFTDDRAIFISRAVQNDIGKYFYVPKALVLPNSLLYQEVSSQRGNELLNSMSIEAEKYFLILIPGRLHNVKGHCFFLQVFYTYLVRFHIKPENFKILLAGDGPEKSAILHNIKDLKLQRYVHLLGSVDNQLMLSLYKCVNLVVIPSLHEGFGNVAIEGLMQQSLMLTSDAGGLDEIIEHGYNGYKFKAGDTEDLIEKFNYIYSEQPVLNSEDLMHTFLQKYTLERQIDDLLKFIGAGSPEN